MAIKKSLDQNILILLLKVRQEYYYLQLRLRHAPKPYLSLSIWSDLFKSNASRGLCQSQ